MDIFHLNSSNFVFSSESVSLHGSRNWYKRDFAGVDDIRPVYISMAANFGFNRVNIIRSMHFLYTSLGTPVLTS